MCEREGEMEREGEETTMEKTEREGFRHDPFDHFSSIQHVVATRSPLPTLDDESFSRGGRERGRERVRKRERERERESGKGRNK